MDYNFSNQYNYCNFLFVSNCDNDRKNETNVNLVGEILDQKILSHIILHSETFLNAMLSPWVHILEYLGECIHLKTISFNCRWFLMKLFPQTSFRVKLYNFMLRRQVEQI